MNTNFKVIGLIRLGIKPKCTAAEADALVNRPSELFDDNIKNNHSHTSKSGLVIRV